MAPDLEKLELPRRTATPFANLPTTLFPSASRACTTATYLYLHILLAPLWERTRTSLHAGPYPRSAPSARADAIISPSKKRKRDEVSTVDPDLLRLLLDTLRADIEGTEEAMQIGADSREVWLWKVVVGAYVVEATGRTTSESKRGEDEV